MSVRIYPIYLKEITKSLQLAKGDDRKFFLRFFRGRSNLFLYEQILHSEDGDLRKAVVLNLYPLVNVDNRQTIYLE